MHNNHEVLQLFPTPVYTTTIPEEHARVVPWFYDQEMLTDEVDSLNYGERSKNSYILNEPECVDLNKFILNETLTFGQDYLGYDYDEYRFSQSWVSYKVPGQHHAQHTHPNSLISGVFYFGDIDDETPSLKFHRMVGAFNESRISPKEILDKREHPFAWSEFNIKASPGLLVLFPSYFSHSVPMNQSEKVSCSLAFNIVTKIGLGDERHLPELIF